jgi:hypothetical protein
MLLRIIERIPVLHYKICFNVVIVAGMKGEKEHFVLLVGPLSITV